MVLNCSTAMCINANHEFKLLFQSLLTCKCLLSFYLISLLIKTEAKAKEAKLPCIISNF